MNDEQPNNKTYTFWKRRTRGCLFVRDIPLGLKDHFLAAAYRRGRSQREVIMAMMRMYVAEPARLHWKYFGEGDKGKYERENREPREET